MVCVDYSWCDQAKGEINKTFRKAISEIRAVNVYRELHMASSEWLVSYVSSLLATNAIYPKDPLPWSYALSLVLDGGQR